MVEREVLLRRLERLEETIEILERLRVYSFEEFVADPERYGSAERFLQVALEALADIGAHVIAFRELGSIKQYRDIPTLLEERGLLSRHQRELWIRMIGFRNVLVHDYLDIDRRIVFDILQTRLDDIAGIARVFARLL